MALKPIDLQVLFSRLVELSREQAAQKELPLHQQAVQNTHMLKQTDQKAHSVNTTPEVEQEVAERIKEEGKRGAGRRGQPQTAKNQQPSPSADDENPVEVVQDPDLGKNVDITG
ncbi:MAG TPA: hypothetical protein PLG79_00160 [Spirochaetales bacterium]|nr:hypothetical protein [Spirochaetales bacterium]HOV37107.1 hypothetical protein [Spirochaetales bacterium]